MSSAGVSSPIKTVLESDDPLSDESIRVLMAYREEDEFIDYKEDFAHKMDKSWLELTKDVSAFANTHGGYLVFGVRNETFEIIGIDQKTVASIFDSSSVMQRINRYIEPDITSIRIRIYMKEEKSIAIMHIPGSKRSTHVFKRDGEFKHLSGANALLFRAHTFYVRRSGSNHLADSLDIENMVVRRLEHYRDTLLKKITRVVDAPPETEVLVVTEAKAKDGTHRFVIENGPDALKIRGLSLALAPQSPQEEVAAWVALNSGNESATPAKTILWQWYAQRNELILSNDQRLKVASFCLEKDVPWFFWLKGCRAAEIKKMIFRLIHGSPNLTLKFNALCMTAFLGKRVHSRVLSELGERSGWHRNLTIRFHGCGPRSLFCPERLGAIRNSGRKKASEEEFRNQLMLQLNEITASVDGKKVKEPDLMERDMAKALDCYLYARDDKYKT